MNGSTPSSLGENISAGNPIITSETSENHMGIHNVVINGADKDVYGIKWQAGCGTNITQNVIVTRTRRPGYWTRGSLDTWVNMSSVKDCGDGSSPAVLIESENDSIGAGSDDTQIRWLGGRISNDNGYSALEFNSSLGRWYDCTLKSSAAPSVTPMPTVNHDGSMWNSRDVQLTRTEEVDPTLPVNRAIIRFDSTTP